MQVVYVWGVFTLLGVGHGTLYEFLQLSGRLLGRVAKDNQRLVDALAPDEVDHQTGLSGRGPNVIE